MSNPWIFKTRNLGPNAKGSALTIDELDNSLLYLSASIDEIEFYPLSGSNYIFVEADGTPIQNANYLTASYNIAKSTNPTGSDRFSVLLGPGRYEFTNDFVINTPYIDVVSLTGDRDIYITGSGTIVIGADNVYVRGIDVGVNNFTITSSFPNVIIKNCKGGDESFGGDSTLSSSYIIGSTFIDCEGGDYSFAGGSGFAYGVFTNCIGGDYSFGQYCDGTFTNCVGGDYSFAYQGDIQGGLIENCTGGDNSFASLNDLNLNAILRNCIGGNNSFMKGGSTISGLLQGCKLTSGDFTSQISMVITNGGIRDCINDNNTTANS